MEEVTENLQEEQVERKLANHSVLTADIAFAARNKATKRGKWFLCFLFLIVFAAAVVTNIPSAMQSTAWEDWLFVGLMAVFFIVIEAWVLLGYEKAVKRNYQNLFPFATHCDYTFSMLCFEVSATSGEGVESYTKIAYHRLQKVEETPDFWILTLNASSEYVVVKSGMTEGSAEELSQWLRPRVSQYLTK